MGPTVWMTSVGGDEIRPAGGSVRSSALPPAGLGPGADRKQAPSSPSSETPRGRTPPRSARRCTLEPQFTPPQTQAGPRWAPPHICRHPAEAMGRCLLSSYPPFRSWPLPSLHASPPATGFLGKARRGQVLALQKCPGGGLSHSVGGAPLIPSYSTHTGALSVPHRGGSVGDSHLAGSR